MKKTKTWLRLLKILGESLYWILLSRFFWDKAFHTRYNKGEDGLYYLDPNTKLSEGQFLWMFLNNDSTDGDFGDNDWFRTDLPKRSKERAYEWQKRNRAWNYWETVAPLVGEIENVDVVKNTLTNHFNKTMAAEYKYSWAGLKWIREDGFESWSNNQGPKISQKYSIFGSVFVYWEIKGVQYVKVSFLKKFTIFAKERWITFGIGTNHIRHSLKLKIQKEK